MRSHSLYKQVLAFGVGCLCSCIWSHVCLADLVVNLPEVTVFADGVNPVSGSFEVFLTLTGDDLTSPPDLSSFNIEFSVASSNITFDEAVAPMSTPLFTDGSLMNFSMDDQTIEAGHDIFSETPSSVAAFDGAALIKVPFTVAAGTFGTFALNTGSLNEFTNAGANSLAASFVGGSISVSAIPETGAWKLFGLISVLVVTIVGLRYKISLSTH